MKRYIVVFLFLLLYGCDDCTVRKNPTVAIYIDLDKEQDISIFDIFSEIDIIPLETNEQSALSFPIQKMVVHNDHYYLLDRKQSALFEFDHTGSFIRCIKKHGRGPGEYSELYDFNSNRFTHNIELMSPWKKIIVYDSLINTYIKTINTGEMIHHTFNLTEDIDVCMNLYRDNTNKMFFFSRKRGKVIGNNYPCPDYITKTPFHHSTTPFYLYHDTVRFYDGVNGDIYSVDPHTLGLVPRHQWDFGKYNFDLSIIPSDRDMKYYIDFSIYGTHKYAMGFTANVENDNYFITSFRFQQGLRTVFFNKMTGKYIYFQKFKEDVNCAYFHNIDNEYLYVVLTPAKLPIVVNNDILTEENQKKLSKIEEEDNPVIIRYKFKNNG